MRNPIEILWPTGTDDPDAHLVPYIGRKAIGLVQIPEAWRPPFFVLSTSAFTEWRSTPQSARRPVIEAASAAIIEAANQFQPYWNFGLILRSSAVGESLNDRGSYQSKSVAADFDMKVITNSLQEVFEQFIRASSNDDLAVVVQPLVPGPRRYIGHTSNERRVSKTINQWMLECPEADWTERFNSQRSRIADVRQALVAENPKELIRVFRSVGRWCTELNRGPCHIEWSWSNAQLMLLQLDFEDESPDDGVDPRVLIRAADEAIIASSTLQSLERVNLSKPNTGWGKIDKLKELANVHGNKFPDLYYVRADEMGNSNALLKEICEVSNGRVVCRTECNSANIEKLNLPRTHSVSPAKAIEFMNDTATRLIARGAETAEICFILHRFIPAAAAAWALADPKAQIVRVDALWGIPDGLQFLPHDTFEYDVRREKTSSEVIRYKVSFIQEVADGSWKEVRIARRFGRSRSLSSADVSEIAAKTYQVAVDLNCRTQIMWFCGIPSSLGIGRNLPWFRMTAPDAEPDTGRSVAPTRHRFKIQTNQDLQDAERLGRDRYVLVLQPDVDLIRNDDKFLRRLADVALQIGAPVELYGSILGHAYYMLRRAGVTVIAVGEPQYSRVRGRRIFAKLVRDEIPQQIHQHGETTVLARIAQQEARTALVVKLFEEAHELLGAGNPSEVEGELADLLEVVRSLASATGVSWEDVESKAAVKRSQRGGFEKGVVLMETAWPTSQAKKVQNEVLVSLKNLGQIKESPAGIDVNFAALLAGGGSNRFATADGITYELSLTGFGLRLRRVDSIHVAEQLKLPGIEDQQ
jgi:predicted house-cleaning noncanonical NTP pyrophosphatase (MazG superfamily)